MGVQISVEYAVKAIYLAFRWLYAQKTGRHVLDLIGSKTY